MARLLWIPKQHVGPSPRAGHTMTYDSGRRRVVLFGGEPSLSDTWEWDGENWTQVDDIGPSGRGHAATAFDAKRGRVVLFGGSNGVTCFGDTWEWNGEDWTLVAIDGPPARTGHALVFDARRQRVVLFGGSRGQVTDQTAEVLNDTWEWDGGEWVQVEDTGPAPRRGHAMAFDTSRGRTVLFGGVSGSDPFEPFGDTWEWDGTSWTQICSFGPPPCLAASLIDNGQRVLLFGGLSGVLPTSTALRLTWEWDGMHWTVRQDLGPGPRWGHAMAFDIARKRGVFFGGHSAAPVGGATPLGDTWETFSEGTAGSSQPPSKPVGVLSVTVASPAIEGTLVEMNIQLTAAPESATEVWIKVTDTAGVNLLWSNYNIEARAQSCSLALPLPAGRYIVFARIGDESLSAAFTVNPSVGWSPTLSVAPATFFSADYPAVTISAALAVGIAPPTIPLVIPLFLTVPGGRPLLYPHFGWLVIHPGSNIGSVTIPGGSPDGSQGEVWSEGMYVWTARLGGVTSQATMTVT